jgi:hypothetical protein
VVGQPLPHHRAARVGDQPPRRRRVRTRPGVQLDPSVGGEQLAPVVGQAGPLVPVVEAELVPELGQLVPGVRVLPGWAEWTIVAVPTVAAAAVLIAASRWNARREAAQAVPDDWCGRCHADLYADRAGRFFSRPGGYLCPPECWRPGERRHQPGRTRLPASGPA